MSAQQMNVLGAGLIGGFCLLSGVGLGAYRAGSSSGRKFKKQAAAKARTSHTAAIKAAQDAEQKRAKQLSAEAKALALEAKDLSDRVTVIERKHPVLGRDTGPYELELLQDATVPLAEVVRRTVEERLAKGGQGRKVEVSKLKTGFQVTIELDTPLTRPMVHEVRLAAADLIKHTPKAWIQNLRITRPLRDRTISLGPLEKLSPVGVGDAVEAFLGQGVRMAAIKPVKGPKSQFVFNGSRYPGTVHWFGPQGSDGSASGSTSGQKNATIAVPPGVYFITANLGGVVFRQEMTVAPKSSYRVNLGAFKFPAGHRPRAGIAVPRRRVPTGYRRRVVPPTRYRSRRRYTPPSRYRSRTTPTRRPTPRRSYR